MRLGSCSTARPPAPDYTSPAGDGDLRFGSSHTGGFNALLADGSVHFLSQTIDMKTYQHLGCRNDGQVLGDF